MNVMIATNEVGSNVIHYISREAQQPGGEMYIGHGRPCAYLLVPRRIPTLLHGAGCKLGE